MRYLLLLLLFAGCATPQREIASFSSTLIPDMAAAYPLDYKGPFELNPDGASRKAAKVYLPSQYEQEKSWPLVILLHGYTGTAESQDKYLSVRYRVSNQGFILVTPEGTANSRGEQFWNATDFCCDFEKSKVDDVAYLSALIEKAQKNYKVDKRRIYLYGHSNGGYMANRMLCEFGGRFAGAAVLAGGSFKDTGLCRVKEAVPYLQIHAEDDPTVKYGTEELYAGGLATVQARKDFAACEGEAKPGAKMDLVLTVPGAETTPSTWAKCGKSAEVSLWTIEAYDSRLHKPHVPLFHWVFTGKVLDFLLKHKLPR